MSATYEERIKFYEISVAKIVRTRSMSCFMDRKGVSERVPNLAEFLAELKEKFL